MIGPFPYGVVPNATHLSQRERAIWSAFMRANPLPDAKCFYDVEVGGMRGSTEGLKPEWEKNAQYLGKYKIDVVVETPAWVCVIEVKGEATTKALGEIWLYDDLLRAEWDIKKPVLNWIVTDEEMPNIRAVCEKEGVELRVVSLTLAPNADGKIPERPENKGADGKTPESETVATGALNPLPKQEGVVNT